MKHLVTVTCTRDLRQMVLQSHSIAKFVNAKLTHHVFIEDNALPIEYWQSILEKFYSGDKQLCLYDIRVDDPDGYIRQLYLKIFAAYHVQDDYLILDSKNFFIKDTTLDYDIPEGSCDMFELLNFGKDFPKWVADNYHLPIPNNLWTVHTPFKMKEETCLRLLELNLLEIFRKGLDAGCWPSEFVLYSFFAADKYNKIEWNSTYFKNKIYHTWWWDNQLNPDEFETIYSTKAIEILGLHKNLWYKKKNNLDKLGKLADWLVTKGLDRQYVNMATINMRWDNTYLQDSPITNLPSDE